MKSIIYSAWTHKAIRSKVQELRPDLKGQKLKEACEEAEAAFPCDLLDNEVHEAIQAALDDLDAKNKVKP